MSIEIKEREFIATRVFDAPVELVWRAFTEPDLIKQWWGPDGFNNTISKMEVKTGGVWEFVMHGPDGTDWQNNCTYGEVIEMEKIVMNHLNRPKFATTITFMPKGIRQKLTGIWRWKVLRNYSK